MKDAEEATEVLSNKQLSCLRQQQRLHATIHNERGNPSLITCTVETMDRTVTSVRQGSNEESKNSKKLMVDPPENECETKQKEGPTGRELDPEKFSIHLLELGTGRMGEKSQLQLFRSEF